MAWTTVDAVADAIGTTPTDTDHLTACVDAANAWAFRRRFAAGYVDAVDIAPDAAVGLGTTMYAVALYRERGTVDSYASFDAFADGAIPPATYGQVNRLLGVPRPACDLPPAVAVPAVAW
jgi:hypothetical protein